ncbi:Two component system, signal transduction response regulator [Acididesulfobacillus acetoxydans]|uniref:Stage 0 sporulation protein A homolog n=1 Tax=Acididesulfobacillus acetoxydans TaxID=1561005 RepID=A0A8S0Y308_9FIRM|nr:LytTR family DNA-binding domain-containing protein [Acididesulfobacillus acetoxydans]CAA7601445.1 Two component system, signal transduction response regulator [Acididesulfobacillus acetoxydans]CEJ08876.1 Sensory transduction protein LytT [Acididesulfobacillus acetoxydans]
MKRLRALIADDEEIMGEALAQLLRQMPDIEVSGVCHDGDEALDLIGKTKPDIAFLDIRMPGLTGIEVAEILKRKEDSPAVVFVTAYDEFALKGYEVDALDYILKPFERADIERVLRKIRKHRLRRLPDVPETGFEAAPPLNAHPEKFCAYDGETMIILDSQTIRLFYAEGGEVFLLTESGERFMLKQTLQEIEQKLDDRRFFRCHRNYIVNMDFVKKITPGFNRGYLLTLQGEKSVEVPVSRAHTKALEQYIYF